VNVHDHDDGTTPPTLDIGSELLDMMRQGTETDPDRSANRALVALLTSGHDVFIERGYHGTRVDDLAMAAGVSHGAFYRYFGSKDQLARILAARAAMAVGTAVLEMPDVSSDGSSMKQALRRWLRRYHVAHSSEAAMLQVWMDASLQDPVLRTESAPLYDWGRRRMARYLTPRAFGDVEMDAVVMVALLGVFGARARSAAEIDAAAHIVERGLLGR
jgi:AcrR family transcriptional regulator